MSSSYYTNTSGVNHAQSGEKEFCHCPNLDCRDVDLLSVIFLHDSFFGQR